MIQIFQATIYIVANLSGKDKERQKKQFYVIGNFWFLVKNMKFVNFFTICPPFGHIMYRICINMREFRSNEDISAVGEKN